MRIEHIHVTGFGRLTDFDTGTTNLGSLVVILGPNEAGKSTLFSFLTTALYGFQPASRELSPFIPWGADEAGGEVRLRLSDGSCAAIARRLRSSPSGTLTFGDESRELRNQPVRWVEHIPRTVFRQVFAITLAELAGLDETMWAGIQDRVLGSMGASDLRSAREVAETLEREAGEIWRPNRRGNQRLRDLQEEIRALRGRRTSALERDREIRRLVEERESVRLRLKDAREERLREKVELERIQELLPLKRQLERIESLRAEGGPRERLVGLPTDLADRRERLVERAETLGREVARLRDEVREPEVTIAAFDDRCRRLLAREAEIRSVTDRVEPIRSDRRRLDEIGTERQEIAIQLRTQSDLLLTDTWTPDHAGIVDTLSKDLLRDRVDRLESVRRLADSRRPRSTAPESPDDAGSPLPSRLPTASHERSFVGAVTLVALGAGLLAWGLSGGPLAATVAGAAALAVGVVLVGVARPAPEGSSTRPPEQTESRDVEAERGALEDEILGMVQGLPLRPDYVDPPGQPLVSGVARLQELTRRESETNRAEALLTDRVSTFLEGVAAVTAGFDDEPAPHDADSALDRATRLRRDLDEALRRRDEAQMAERLRARLQREIERVESEANDVADRLSRLDARIRAVEAPPAADGQLDALDAATPVDVDVLARAQARLDAHARADRLREELDTLHPDLETLIERIREADEAGATWVHDEEDLAARKVRLELLDETIEQLVAKAEALDGAVARLRDMETVDEVDGEVDSLREEEQRLVRDRDRKWLLARLLREADRRFREEHQPDLVRRASEYLARLTAGRYDRLLVDEEAGGDLFQIMGPQLPAPVPLSRPISTGTLEQAYLGLRLAIVDHLDHGDERLPLFMDEAFVNWDEERREQGLTVLAEVARTRQVFAFTCHPAMAEELARRGACVLRLQ